MAILMTYPYIKLATRKSMFSPFWLMLIIYIDDMWIFLHGSVLIFLIANETCLFNVENEAASEYPDKASKDNTINGYSTETRYE